MNRSILPSLDRANKKIPKRTRRQLASACRATVEFLETRVLMAVDTWMNPAGGDWDTPGNWSLDRVPLSTDDATINTGTLITHNKGSADFVHSLTSTQTIDFSAGSLTIGTTFTNNAMFTLAGAVINGGVITTGTGSSFTLINGVLNNTTLAQAGSNTAALTLTSSGGLLNNITIPAGSMLDATNNANINVTAGFVLNGTADVGNAAGTEFGRLNFVGSQTISGSGTILMGPYNANYLAITDDSAGDPRLTIGNLITIQAVSGTIGNGSGDNGLQNNGTILATTAGDTLVVTSGESQGITNNGNIECDNGATLTVTQLQTNSITGELTLNSGEMDISGQGYNNAGRISEAAGILQLGGNFDLLGLGNLSVTGGVVDLTGTLNNTNTTLSLTTATTSSNANGTFTEPGPWYLDGGTILNGGIQTAPATSLILTANGGTLSNVGLAGAVIDGTQFSNANTIVQNGISGSGQINLGSPTNGSLYGRLFVEGSQVLGGTVTVNFGISGSNAIYLQDLNGTAATLTIGSGAIVQGLVGQILPQNGDVSIVNNGTIDSSNPGDIISVGAGISGGSVVNNGIIEAQTGGTLILAQLSINLDSLSVSGAGSELFISGNNYNNTNGTFSLAGGTLNIGGTVATSELGTLNTAGGTINLTGTLNNTGDTLSLTTATTSSSANGTFTEPGPWNLAGGTILGGTVQTSTGASLILSSDGGTLDGVSVAGAIDGTEVAGANAIVMDGLFGTGQFDLGSPTNGSLYGRLFFVGTQLLGGTSTVNFGLSNSNALYVQDFGGTATTLTIGAGALVQGLVGAIIPQAGDVSVVNDGQIVSSNAGDTITIAAGSTSGSVVNNGFLNATAGGTLVVTQFSSNTSNISVGAGSSLSLSGTNYVNTGIIQVGPGTLNLGGSFATSGLGNFQNSGGTINITGTLNNTGDTLTLVGTGMSAGSGPNFAEPGPWNLVGGTIIGGSVGTSDGTELVLTGTGGTLNGISIPGNVIDDTESGGANATIVNGISGTGFINIGSMTDASIYGRLFFLGSEHISGSLQLTFGLSGSNDIFVNDNGPPATLTIDSGASIDGLNGGIIPQSGDVSIVNNGGIFSQFAGDTISIGAGTTSGTVTNNGFIAAEGGTLSITQLNTNSGTLLVASANTSDMTISGTNYVNTGSISITQGTLNLGGIFTLAGLAGSGSFSNTGGPNNDTVNLTGILTNTGTTLALSTAITSGHSGPTTTVPGPINLVGGTIIGGVVSDVPGADLILTGTEGEFNGVTIAAGSVVDGTEVANANAFVTNGLTVNGTLTLGSPAASTNNYGRLFFEGSQTLAGTGLIVFGSDLNNDIFVNDAVGAATLNIAAGITIQAGAGQIYSQSGDTNLINNGTIIAETPGENFTINAGSTSGTVTNAGSIQVNSGATLTINQLATNMATGFLGVTGTDSVLTLNGSNYTNTGTISNGGGTLNLGGTVATLNLGHLAIPGGFVNLTGTLNNTGTTLNLTASSTSSVSGQTYSEPGPWNLLGGTINGGAISDSGGANLVLGSTTGVLNNVTINAGSIIDGSNNSNTDITGGLTLNGTLNLGNVGGTTYGRLFFQGTQILVGTGTINLNSDGNNLLQVNDTSGAATLIIDPGITIQGANGIIGDGSSDANLLNGGTINADVSGGTITVGAGTTSGFFSNSGTLEANSGGTLAISQFAANSGAISVTGTASVVTINGGNGSTFVNSGMISMTSGTLNFGGSLTTGLLAGTGTIQISGGTVNITGSVDNTGSTLNFATVGTSSHSGSTFTLPGAWRLAGGSISNGAVSDQAGAELTLTNNGGTLMDLTLTAGSVLDGTEAPNSYATITSDGVNPGLTVNGEVDLGAPTAATSNYGRLFFVGSQSLAGTGNIVFGSNGNNEIFVNDSGSPATLTIAGGVTILGGDGVISPQASDVSIVNQGTIGDSISGDTLTISAGGTSGTITNSGTLYATNGGTLNVTQLASSSGMISVSIAGSLLSFAGTGFANTGSIGVSAGSLNIGGTTTPAGLGNVSNTGGTINLTGTLTNTGGTLAITNATSSSTVAGTTTFPGPLFLRGGTIVGGAIAGSGLTLTGTGGALAGVTITAGSTVDATQAPNAYTNINGGLVLNGAINLGSPTVGSSNYGRLFFIGSQTLNGTGLITFGTNGNNAMYVQDSSSAATLTISSGITIKGGNGGIIDQNSDVSIINNGAINSTGSGNTISIAAGNSGAFTNNGTLSANSGGTFNLSSAVSNVGTFNITPGARVAVGGNFSQTAAGNINLQVGGPPPSTANFGVLAVSGAASLAGNFNVTLANNYIPVNTNNFTVTTFGSSTGSITFNLPSNAEYAFSKSVNASNIVLTANGIGDTAPAITNSSTTLNFSVGEMSSYTITTTGTPAPALTESGSLPGGVTFHDNMDGTATISGTPVAGTIGNYSALITAANNVTPNAVKNFTVNVGAAAVAAITSANAKTFTVGSAGSFTITTAGFAGTPAITETGTVPGGLTFRDNGNGTATLSGTPLTADANNFSLLLTATSGGTMATQTLSLTIDSAAAITNGNIATFAVNAPAGFNFTTTGFPAPNLKIMPTPPSGLTFVDNGNGTATLSGTPGAGTGGQYAFTVTAANGVGTAATQTFMLNINQALAFTSVSSVTFGAGAINTFTITTSGFPIGAITATSALPSGLTLVDNHDGTATLSGTPATGVYSLSLKAANGVSTNARQTLNVTVNQAAVITSANTINFAVGAAGLFTFTTAGVPAPTLMLTPTPPSGLSFHDNGDGTATLSGTPAVGTSGQYTLTLVASNGIGTAVMQSLTLSINQDMAIISGSSATFTAGVSNNFTITTTGFPVGAITKIGALPGGVTLTDNHDGTATLSGSPTQGGVFNFTISASNGITGNAMQSFALTVNQAPVFTSATSFTFAINVAGSFTFTTNAFPFPTITLVSGLPSGFSFVDDGDGTAMLTGTPTTNQGGVNIPLSLTASNGLSPDASAMVTLSIAAPVVTMMNNGSVSVTGTAGADMANLSVSGSNVILTIDGMSTTMPAGSSGGSMLNLGAGSDSIALGNGVPPVNINGGGGSDTIMGNNNSANTLSGGAGNDMVVGGSNSNVMGAAGSDMLIGGTGATLSGGGGSDTVTGSGHNVEMGGAGDDFILDAGTSGNTVSGGAGLNFAQTNPGDSMSGIFQVIDPTPPTSPAVAAATSSPAVAPAAGLVVSATVISGELDVEGTAGNDSIKIVFDGTNIDVSDNGSPVGSFPVAGDALTGIIVNGRGGGDTINIDASVLLNATVNGGAGPDSVTGGGGSNVLSGGAGSDTLIGGEGTNVLFPGLEETFAAALSGKDLLIGGSGFNIADLSYREDGMFLSNDGRNDSGDPAIGEHLTIMPSVQAIWGGSGADTIVGTTAGEFLSGGNGPDTITGGGANDLIVGGLGKDTVRVAAEPVTLYLRDGKVDDYTGVTNALEDVLEIDPTDQIF